MKTKYLDKRGWGRVISHGYQEKLIQTHNMNVLVGLIQIKKVKSPLSVRIIDKKRMVVDNGYSWLQILPEDKKYSITVMYDENDNVIQYYFDINVKNILELGNARRKDIYLDVLVLPDGRYELVDEVDIKRALKKKKINKQQYEQAYEEAKRLMNDIDARFEFYQSLTQSCFNSFKH